jgi:hypothetical protein
LKPYIFVWIRGKNFPLAELNAAHAAAAALGLDTVRCKIRGGQDIAPALEVLKGNADALYVCIDPLVNTNGVRINALVLAARLPTMHGSRDNIDAGGMVSHGPDTTDLFRRAARVCRQNLARGEPGDLPVEQPTKFKLIINLKAAKALGLDISSTLLARADEVIEQGCCAVHERDLDFDGPSAASSPQAVYRKAVYCNPRVLHIENGFVEPHLCVHRSIQHRFRHGEIRFLPSDDPDTFLPINLSM